MKKVIKLNKVHDLDRGRTGLIQAIVVSVFSKTIVILNFFKNKIIILPIIHIILKYIKLINLNQVRFI
jgi:hypothetical protein